MSLCWVSWRKCSLFLPLRKWRKKFYDIDLRWVHLIKLFYLSLRPRTNRLGFLRNHARYSKFCGQREENGATTLSITTLSIKTFSKTTFSIKSLSIQGLYMTLSINYTERNWTFSTTRLCIMISVIMVNVTFYLLLCWVLLPGMSLCWVSLCWMSWRAENIINLEEFDSL